VIGSGQGVVYYCLDLSLLRKEPGRVFVMPLQLTVTYLFGILCVVDYVDLDDWVHM